MAPKDKPELFSEYQMNHLVGTFRHVDHLLAMIEAATTDDSDKLFPSYVRDVNPAQREKLLAFVKEFREHLVLRMRKYNIERPSPKTTASHAVSAALSFIDIGLDDLRPGEMRGYGPVSESAGTELHALIREFQSLTASAVQILKRRDGGVAT